MKIYRNDPDFPICRGRVNRGPLCFWHRAGFQPRADGVGMATEGEANLSERASRVLLDNGIEVDARVIIRFIRNIKSIRVRVVALTPNSVFGYWEKVMVDCAEAVSPFGEKMSKWRREWEKGVADRVNEKKVSLERLAGAALVKEHEELEKAYEAAKKNLNALTLERLRDRNVSRGEITREVEQSWANAKRAVIEAKALLEKHQTIITGVVRKKLMDSYMTGVGRQGAVVAGMSALLKKYRHSNRVTRARYLTRALNEITAGLNVMEEVGSQGGDVNAVAQNIYRGLEEMERQAAAEENSNREETAVDMSALEVRQRELAAEAMSNVGYLYVENEESRGLMDIAEQLHENVAAGLDSDVMGTTLNMPVLPLASDELARLNASLRGVVQGRTSPAELEQRMRDQADTLRRDEDEGVDPDFFENYGNSSNSSDDNNNNNSDRGGVRLVNLMINFDWRAFENSDLMRKVAENSFLSKAESTNPSHDVDEYFQHFVEADQVPFGFGEDALMRTIFVEDETYSEVNMEAWKKLLRFALGVREVSDDLAEAIWRNAVTVIPATDARLIIPMVFIFMARRQTSNWAEIINEGGVDQADEVPNWMRIDPPHVYMTLGYDDLKGFLRGGQHEERREEDNEVGDEDKMIIGAVFRSDGSKERQICVKAGYFGEALSGKREYQLFVESLDETIEDWTDNHERYEVGSYNSAQSVVLNLKYGDLMFFYPGIYAGCMETMRGMFAGYYNGKKAGAYYVSSTSTQQHNDCFPEALIYFLYTVCKDDENGEENDFPYLSMSCAEMKKELGMSRNDLADEDVYQRAADKYGMNIRVYGRSEERIELGFEEYCYKGFDLKAEYVCEERKRERDMVLWVDEGHCLLVLKEDYVKVAKRCWKCKRMFKGRLLEHARGEGFCQACLTEYSRKSKHVCKDARLEFVKRSAGVKTLVQAESLTTEVQTVMAGVRESDRTNTSRKRIACWDCETARLDSDDPGQVVYSIALYCDDDVYSDGSSAKERVWVGQDSVIKFVDWLKAWNEDIERENEVIKRNTRKGEKPKKVQGTLITFNGSNFDNLFMLRELVRREASVTDIIEQNGGIIALTIEKNIKAWDLNRFISGSLASVCKQMGTKDQKKDFEHNLKSWDEVTAQKDKIIEYVMNDVRCTYQAYEIFADTMFTVSINQKRG